MCLGVLGTLVGSYMEAISSTAELKARTSVTPERTSATTGAHTAHTHGHGHGHGHGHSHGHEHRHGRGHDHTHAPTPTHARKLRSHKHARRRTGFKRTGGATTQHERGFVARSTCLGLRERGPLGLGGREVHGRGPSRPRACLRSRSRHELPISVNELPQRGVNVRPAARRCGFGAREHHSELGCARWITRRHTAHLCLSSPV